MSIYKNFFKSNKSYKNILIDIIFSIEFTVYKIRIKYKIFKKLTFNYIIYLYKILHLEQNNELYEQITSLCKINRAY